MPHGPVVLKSVHVSFLAGESARATAHKLVKQAMSKQASPVYPHALHARRFQEHQRLPRDLLAELRSSAS